MTYETETRSVPLRDVPEPPRMGIVSIFSEVDENVPPSAISERREIGRSPTADLFIGDPRVSRVHAVLSPTVGGLMIEDARSHNGTYLNGVLINTSEVAGPGSIVRVGTTLLMVVADTAAYRRAPLGSGESLIGGPAIDRLRSEIRDYARSSAPVLIEGESGTGKELVARAIHQQSGREGALVCVNCSAMPHDLVESELFGHLGGSFSGAQDVRAGLFRAAEGGTLLLDELGDLPGNVQAKLLRALEDGEVRPVGSDRARRVDARIVAATNQALLDLVANGGFRDDLYHRIAAVRLETPPLRDHLEDLPALARSFLTGFEARLSADVVEALLCRTWPGNVRQLRNVVRVAATRADAQGAEFIVPDHLPRSPSSEIPPESHEDQELRACIETALAVRGGNVSHVARDLAMRRPALYEHLRRLRIDPKRYRGI